MGNGFRVDDKTIELVIIDSNVQVMKRRTNLHLGDARKQL